MISQGDFNVFVARPISLIFLVITILFLGLPVFKMARTRLAKIIGRNS